MPLFILFIELKMNNRFEKKEKKEKIIYAGEYSDRNNRCWGFPEYMEEYRLARGYEWRDGLLREKVDPRCLNEHGIPTNDFNLPAVPGMNTLPMNARIATKNRYLDQCNVSGYVIHDFDGNWPQEPLKIPLIDRLSTIEEVNHQRISGNIKDIPGIENFFRKEIVGRLNRETKDGCLIIPKSGNYIIYYVIEFYYSQHRNYENAHNKIYSEVRLYDNNWGEDYIWRSAKYTITVPDYINWTIACSIKWGQKIWLSCRLKAIDKCFVRWWLTAIKLAT